jgi:hypothetical protein
MKNRPRRFTKPLEASIEADGRAVRCDVIDISTEGLCIEIPKKFNIPNEFTVIVYFPGPSKVKVINQWEKVQGINKKVGLKIISKDNNWDSFLSSYHLDVVYKRRA